MGIATFCSRIMGLVREQAFAILFGASNATDAFNVAFRIPNLLRDLFGEGAMSASLVPNFTRARAEAGDRRGWRVAGLVFRVLAVVVSLVAVLGVVFAPELANLYAGAFKEVPGKFELTVRLTRIMFPFFPLVACAAAFMGILNACGVFFLPAFASALFNIASVAVGVALALLFQGSPQWGFHPIEGMAIGVLAGGVVQAFCQLPALYRAGYRWSRRDASEPSWNADPYLKSMLWMMLPGTLGLAATQINILVNTILATSQEPGAVSWLSYAFRLMQFPIGVFGVSLAAATLPRVSRQWVAKDATGASQTVSQSLRHVFAVNLPASAGLAFLSVPIIQVIFEYGRFSATDTQATAMALVMYSVGLTAYSAVKVLVPACYAMGNTRLPVISSVLTVLMTIGLNLVMIRPFGYWGLALGTSLAAIFNFLFLTVSVDHLLRKAGSRLPLGGLARTLTGHALSAMAMGVVCTVSYRFVAQYSLGLPVVLERVLKLGIVIFAGIVVLIALAKVFRMNDTTQVFDLFATKLKKKLMRKAT